MLKREKVVVSGHNILLTVWLAGPEIKHSTISVVANTFVG